MELELMARNQTYAKGGGKTDGYTPHYVTKHPRLTPPCGRCGTPLLPTDQGCPRCAGAHWKEVRCLSS